MTSPHDKIAAYPLAFHLVVKEGEGLLDPRVLGWTKLAIRTKFRAYIAALRALTTHPLHKSAARREWQLRETESGAWLVEGVLMPGSKAVVNRVSIAGWAKRLVTSYPDYP